ncbi:HBR536Wp [Eremothecium sinecaudum]|uniref:Mannosyltransferase n=1 Tax=Eremothecium sinecaudum TaxID=45286 RepID=A0A109UY40_9SACH|nr:HBR536Wp [Eremothecium sinecaudum]AMD19437.1 HBR536Wp [Eremothecium sinecaudum]
MRSNVTVAVLVVLLVCRLFVQPAFSLISDCDESYNYWEPLNLLVRGFGKQTWEYSPEYSIRSWTFLLPFHAILSAVKRFLIYEDSPRYVLFYFARAVLGLTSFIFEKRLYDELLKSTSDTVANAWLVFQIFNPGWFHASVELLPSSIAMIFLLGYLRDSLRYLSKHNEKPFVSLLFYNFAAGMLGWPFVLVLSVPMVIHYVFNHRLIDTLRTGFSSSLVLSLITGIVVLIDSIMYGRLTLVPWNIVRYNVINADEAAGPNIFGTEPWYYYLFNLLLNLPIPVLILSVFGLSHKRLWPIWGSIMIWLTTFILQPHKEERFLYPIYGFITLAASFGYAKILRMLKHRRTSRQLLKLLTLAVVAIQATTRIIALINNYTAPLTVFSALQPAIAYDEPIQVCIGREWYHFPNSFFLPDSHRLGFVSSGFNGLLPGDFLEHSSIFDSIRTTPPNMNKFNLFDAGKLVPVKKCQYYVDIIMESDNSRDALDPTKMSADWAAVSCSPIIDVANSKFFGRAFALPPSLIEALPKSVQSLVQKFYKANFVNFCLFERMIKGELV